MSNKRVKNMSIHPIFERYWQFNEENLDWKSAIQLVGNSLIENNIIEQRYITSIIDNVNQIGAYFIIADGFALPHSRSENGVICEETKFSLLKCTHPVIFPDGEKISLLIMLAASDNNKHIDAMSELIEWLEEDDRLDNLINVDNKIEFENLLFK